MITPQDVLRMCSMSASLLEERIDKALAISASTNHWPCTLALTDLLSVAPEVVKRYHDAGWNISINTQDPREPPFIMIQKPTR